MPDAWWKSAVVYQVYPRSFKDSNGDGIGDLRGVIEKLDYLKELGVDVVWLSPVYRSPNDDNGYDISDYQDINPEFGTLADWDELAAGLHARGMKIVMDLVVNHSSDEHPWFVSARQSKDSPFRDFYIWREGRNGAEPNNWASFFGGSAWEYNAPTGDYYLHLFSKKQPDLNWENPALRRAVHAMMHWWLERGVDGFRMDVINAISKDTRFPDAQNPDGTPYVFAPQYFIQGPRLGEFYGEMKREVLSRYDLMTVGEAAMTSTEDAAAVTHGETGTLNMVFTFEHTDIDMEKHGFSTKWHAVPFDLARLKAIKTKWQRAMEDAGWNSLYFNNHDQPRAVSRFGHEGVHRAVSAKMLATVLHMLKGTPYVYQGEELGMTNVAFPRIEDYRDIETLNGYRDLVDNQGFSPEEALRKIQFRSRDNARTPMPWTAGPNAGFTTGTPWLGLNPNYPEINVERERADPDSVFHYYRRLIVLRKAHPVMVHGRYEPLLDDHDKIYAFTRTLGADRLLVVASFSADAQAIAAPLPVPDDAEVLIANYPVEPEADPGRLALRPFEARVYRMRAGA